MKEQILELMSKPGYKALVPRQIMEQINSDNLTAVMKCLNELDREHLIIHDNVGHYALLSYFHIYIGVINVKEIGMGFVQVDGFDKDIYVGKRDTLNAMDGDTVYVQFTKNTTRGPEGVVVDIIERRFKEFIGVIKKRKNGYSLQIKGKYSYLTIVINQKHLKNAKVNEVVKATIIDYGNGFLLKAKVDKVLGDKNQVGMDISMMIENAGISTDFSVETKQYVEDLSSDIYLDNRINRTNEMIVTIDGDDAKDFDDAITVKKLDDNKYMLGVFIADVSHYVTYNSPLDIDASLKTSSCYLPDRVVPMLPFRLSDDLCSLKPHVNRYALAVEMIIENGKVIDSEIFETVINSKYRLTYNEVNKMFEENSLTSDLKFLNDAKELATILEKKRKARGSLDFETKEAKVILDNNGYPIDIVPINRGISEKIIEEFMICCNETVTERISYLDLPFVYRIHEEPKAEKYQELVEIAKTLGINIPKKQNSIHPLFIQTILEKPQTEETKVIFNHLILRSMAKARYSETNLGHFGLASQNYTHFTSPIRRYSDLVVHRLVKDYLLNGSNYQGIELEEYLRDVCNQNSNQEKVIERLERDVLDMKKAEYMLNKIGHVYEGIVSGVQKWGFYVQLANSVEGLVLADDLYDDGFEYNEEKGIWYKSSVDVYKIGKPVLVRVLGASKDRGTVDFKLLGGVHFE